MVSRRRNLTVVAAAAYFLAVTLAGLFHNHGGGGCGLLPEYRHRCASPDEGRLPDSDRCHHSGTAHPGGRPCDRSSPEGRHCPVCEFLAQNPLAVEHVEEVTSAALPQEVLSAVPLCFSGCTVSAWHSRAPPAPA
jgi:hypothetical protein